MAQKYKLIKLMVADYHKKSISIIRLSHTQGNIAYVILLK